MSTNLIYRLFFLALAVLATPALYSAEDDPVQRPAKPTEHGMELFSWHKKGEETWHFALLPAPGLDKLKSVQTVTAKESTLDLPALKKKLAALAMGEKVGWFNMIEKAENPPDNIVFDLPPKEIVKELELYCTVLKVRLNIFRSAKK